MTFVDYEKRGHVAVITLNRPDRLNALGRELSHELRVAENDFAEDENSWVLVYTGTGRAFSAGIDVRDRVERQDAGGAAPPPLPAAIEITKPTIAAVNGLCYGAAFEMTQRMDIRICADIATFAMPEVKRGVVPPTGMFYLPRLIGRSDALWMMMSGEAIDADTALRTGLVTRVVSADQLLGTAIEMAEQICANGPLAVRTVRKLVKLVGEVPLDYGQRLAAQEIAAVWSSEDQREGMRSFLEKRPPVWTGT
ncbi:MAG: enoyl-CoA hydratase/isomerase family protein [Chloroflexi bacterium]|nr:enoyl-CoA hydratase/isomerase family protein [Chloroflexota bacterium]MDA1239210.1 enoyl-CoA hydratase/isomerase family protein [Chloroflexota bacterium]